MSSTSPMYFEQPIVIRDTTEALNTTTGSFVLYGGVSVNATYQSTNYSSGAFTLAGGMGIAKNLNVGGAANVAGITRITNTAESLGSGSGALIVDGGVGIAKDLNVAGNTTIFGNLFVAGTTTQVNTETIVVADNTFVLNSGPAGSRDGGLLIHRSGVDVTEETAVTSGTLDVIAQTSFTLGSAFTGNYAGWWLRTTEGSAQIHTYNGTTGTFYTGGNTLGVSPTELDFSLHNRSYFAQYYDESDDEVRFAYIGDAEDPKTSLENNQNYANARMNVLNANTAVSTANLSVSTSATIANLALSTANLAASTIGNLFVSTSFASGGPATFDNTLTANSTSVLNGAVTAGALAVTGATLLRQGVTAGALNVTGASLLQGGITGGSINITGESLLQGAVTVGALAVTGASYFSGDMMITGGNLTVTGGSIVFNTVDVSPSMADIVKERSATIGNNITSATDVLGFSFDNAVARAFDAVVSAAVSGTSGNSYAYYNLKGVQKDSGNWYINSSFVGDLVGITFSINNGQVQYTTLNKSDFSSGVVKFRALTTTV